MADATSAGWDGTISDDRRGCIERTCCEDDCCSTGTAWDAATAYCLPGPGPNPGLGRQRLAPDDIECRFNKITIIPGRVVPSDFLPMTPADYPIHGVKAAFLKNSTNSPSVVTVDDHECQGENITEIITKIGGSPPYPSSDSNSPYWVQLKEVVDWQKTRMANGSAPCTDLMPLPDIWSGYTINDCAEAVHDEFPGSHHINLLTDFLGDGLASDDTIIPERCVTPFLRGPVMYAGLNAWSIGIVGPLNFAAKYYVGYPRPEEVAYKIHIGELDAGNGVPQDLVDCMRNNFTLGDATDFTAYPEGSPQHPSWPAMHSAASSASFWLEIVADLTQQQRCQARLLDYAVATARTVAGVHYRWDNCGGLDMGQEVIARKLGPYLAQKYGANETLVNIKIAAKRFSWCFDDPLAGC